MFLSFNDERVLKCMGKPVQIVIKGLIQHH